MNKMGRMLGAALLTALMLGATILPAGMAAAEAARYEGDGFDTPEAAVACYLEGLKNLDFERMLDAFAWETQAEHFSVEAQIQRMRVYSTSVKPRFPSADAFLVAANLHAIRAAQTDMIYRALEFYMLGEDYPATGNVILKEEGQREEFLLKFSSGKLERLTQMDNIRYVSPDAVTNGSFSSERMRENYAKQTAIYGADEVVDIVALADVGSETLYCCPTVARYGDRWYLVSVGSFTSSLLGVGIECQAFACGEGLGNR